MNLTSQLKQQRCSQALTFPAVTNITRSVNSSYPQLLQQVRQGNRKEAGSHCSQAEEARTGVTG